MQQLPLLAAGPVTTGVTPFLKDGLPPPVDAGTFLADLIDVRGAVALADALAVLDAEPLVPFARSSPDDVRDRLQAELTPIIARLRDAFANALKPRYRLPGPVRIQHLLEQAGALTLRKGRPLTSATRALWAPFEDFLETHLKRARFALRDLRMVLAPDLRALGTDAARLERLDTAVTHAIRPGFERLQRRALAACSTHFADALKLAVRDLSVRPTPDEFAAAFGEGGVVGATLNAARPLVFGLVEHDRARLVALVDACCAVASELAPDLRAADLQVELPGVDGGGVPR